MLHPPPSCYKFLYIHTEKKLNVVFTEMLILILTKKFNNNNSNEKPSQKKMTVFFLPFYDSIVVYSMKMHRCLENSAKIITERYWFESEWFRSGSERHIPKILPLFRT